ncbi:MAG TPA: Gfo/Idh/MocA family oxidoreductase [Solirubrobacteraceae bacterium]|nr:Gfo/Idh/MocA family oxidoreductase [Solirubrobacteraceae bacterium]
MASDHAAPGRRPLELEDVIRPPVRDAVPPLPVGLIGAGWIARECHLPAYRQAGVNVVGIASRRRQHAEELVRERGCRAVGSWQELVASPEVAILDIAYPPDRQPEVILEACRHGDHIRGILAQKPLAPDLATATAVARAAESAGIALAVNQNMRYDRSIRSLRALLDDGRFGRLLFAQINMHAPVAWMEYAREYERKGMLIMSIHHLDCFRYLFGEPERILASVAGPAPAPDGGPDESAAYILEYADGLRAIGIDDCHSWADIGISWRVEGTAGIAKGTIGWPDHPWGSPSTLDFVAADAPARWFSPRWPERWFPDAFAQTMGALLRHVADGAPLDIAAQDNLATMALLEAAYRSAAEHRAVSPNELSAPPGAAAQPEDR